MDDDFIREDDRRPERRPEPRPREPHSGEPRRRAQKGSGGTGVIIAVVVVVVLLLGGLVFVAAMVPVYLAQKDDSQIDHARADVKLIGDACASFNVRYGRYPESLDELVEPPNGGRAYFTEDKLVDPWGMPYQYDPNTNNPTTGEPLVWTIAPRGQKISNW